MLGAYSDKAAGQALMRDVLRDIAAQRALGTANFTTLLSGVMSGLTSVPGLLDRQPQLPAVIARSQPFLDAPTREAQEATISALNTTVGAWLLLPSFALLHLNGSGAQALALGKTQTTHCQWRLDSDPALAEAAGLGEVAKREAAACDDPRLRVIASIVSNLTSCGVDDYALRLGEAPGSPVVSESTWVRHLGCVGVLWLDAGV